MHILDSETDRYQAYIHQFLTKGVSYSPYSVGKFYSEDDPYVRMIEGIVRQAAKDLKNALLTLEKNPCDVHAKIMVYTTTKFFLSDWFIFLTGVDGRAVLNRIGDGHVEIMEARWDTPCNR